MLLAGRTVKGECCIADHEHVRFLLPCDMRLAVNAKIQVYEIPLK